MFYLVYKTTNLLDGKFYIGTHRTTNIHDGYMGSGKYLKHAIEKFGIENFRREILFTFDNANDMFAKEAELVTEDMIASKNTYNLKVGGFGGWDHINKDDNPERIRKNRRAREKTNQVLKNKYGQDWKIILARKAGQANFKKYGLNKKWIEAGRTSFKGRTHSDETKAKMRQRRLGKVDGIKNPQYGKMWITNGLIEQTILKTATIPEGFRRGRITSKLP